MESSTEVTSILETENNKTIQEQIETAMSHVSPNHRSPDKENQKQALEQLNPDFLTELRAHVNNDIRIQEEREKKEEERVKQGGKGNEISHNMNEIRENPKDYIKGLLKGEIFEKLVMVDPAIRKDRLTESNLTTEEIEFNENLSKEILSVMQNPARFGLEEKIQLKRLPDATYLEINDQGKVIITGVGEAKSGFIGDRFFSQADNYRDSIEVIAKELSKLRHTKRLRNVGLEYLASRMEYSNMEGESNFVQMSDDFRISLIIPQDGFIKNPRVEDKVDIILRSSFTTDEINAVTSWSLSELAKIDDNFKFEKDEKN